MARMAVPSMCQIREVGPRDGLQNEAPVPVAERVRLIDALAAAGVRRIEAASFVHPSAIPAMAGAEEVLAAIERRPGVSYTALVPNRRGAERALAAGADELEAVVSASATHNLKNLRRTPDETIGEIAGVIELAHAAGRPVDAGVATCFGCPYEGDIDPAVVAGYARRLVDLGADTVFFGDTTGMGSPRRVDERRRLDAAHPGGGEGVDEPDPVGHRHRRLVLQAVPRPHLADVALHERILPRPHPTPSKWPTEPNAW